MLLRSVKFYLKIFFIVLWVQSRDIFRRVPKMVVIASKWRTQALFTYSHCSDMKIATGHPCFAWQRSTYEWIFIKAMGGNNETMHENIHRLPKFCFIGWFTLTMPLFGLMKLLLVERPWRCLHSSFWALHRALFPSGFSTSRRSLYLKYTKLV